MTGPSTADDHGMTASNQKPRRDKTHCGGRKRQGEGTCTRPAGWGTPHVGIGACKLHGGTTPNAITHANRTLARMTANAYGIPRHIDPHEGLIEEYWRSAGIVAGLEAKVATIPTEDLVWGVAETSTFPEGDDEDGNRRNGGPVTKSKAAPNIWLKLFNEERDRYAKLGLEIVRLGLEARRDQYVRAQVSAITGVLLNPQLALSEDQRRTAASLLRALDSTAEFEPA